MSETSTQENIKEEEKKEVVPVQETVQETEQEDPAEKNWKALREKKKEEKRLREEQERKIAEQQEMIKAMEKLLTQQPTQQQPQAQKQSNGVDIHDEEWITGKQFKAMQEQERKAREEEKKRYEEQQKQRETQARQSELHSRIQRDIPDYQTVLSEDNLAYLETYAPQEAEIIKHISDPYYQTLEAYRKVKQHVPQLSDLDKAKMERAKETPQSPSQVSGGYGQSTNRVNPRRVSEQQRMEMWREMRNAAKG